MVRGSSTDLRLDTGCCDAGTTAVSGAASSESRATLSTPNCGRRSPLVDDSRTDFDTAHRNAASHTEQQRASLLTPALRAAARRQ